jgi:hypothetical protein
MNTADWGKSHIVEEVIGTSQLLQCLKYHTKDDAVHHPRTLEHLDPAVPSTPRSLLGIQLFLDLEHFLHDYPMVLGYTIQLGHGSFCPVCAAVTVIVSRAFGEEEDANPQDKTPEKSDSKRDSP